MLCPSNEVFIDNYKYLTVQINFTFVKEAIWHSREGRHGSGPRGPARADEVLEAEEGGPSPRQEGGGHQGAGPRRGHRRPLLRLRDVLLLLVVVILVHVELALAVALLGLELDVVGVEAAGAICPDIASIAINVSV